MFRKAREMKLVSRFKGNKAFVSERGAALVTVVILMALMLAVSGSIVYVTVLSNQNTTDLVAEKQAYDAAEAGMQLTLNVLRGNSSPGLSFKDAAIRTTSNKDDDWYPIARLSNWLNYSYPASQPDRVPLTSPYDAYNGSAFSVEIVAPDYVPSVVPTPNPNWVDGPVNKPANGQKPAQPAWHPWHCGHCSWDYTHCSLYNPPANGTLRADGFGCRHRHCIPPPGWGQPAGGAFERLLLRVTGYGPRGAKQQIELMVSRQMFTYDDEAVFFVRSAAFGGGDVTFSVSGTPKVTFDGGDNMKAFALTSTGDQTVIQNVINQPDKITITGKGDDYEVLNTTDPEFSDWLQTADAARKLVSNLEFDAKVRSRWFTSYPTGNDGTDSAPELTFIRGDATITSDGAGILVVTGTLTITTDRKFKGLILLLGDGTLRINSGKPSIEGCTVMARFGTTGDFLAPVLNFNGSPEVTFKHNESAMDKAMRVVNIAVRGVREK